MFESRGYDPAEIMNRPSLSQYSQLTAFVCFLSIAFWPSTPLIAQTQKVRISISSRSNTSVPYYVAASKGFFREEGMDVEIIQANPRLGVMALINGDVAFTGTFVSTVRGILSGFPLKIVLVVFKKGVYYLIAHPSIKDIQDLRGKKLGVSSIRGSESSGRGGVAQIQGLEPRSASAGGLGRYRGAFAISNHRRGGSDDAVAATRSHGANIGWKDSGRPAGNRHAGFRHDHFGPLDQRKSANGQASFTGDAQSQSLY
jgi:hypothetical protein